MLIKHLKYLFTKYIMEIKTPLYLLQPKLYHLNTKIISKQAGLFQFEDTIFHLQGGGQPNDKGWISVQESKYEIIGGSIDKESGSLKYKLSEGAEAIDIGSEVQMIIDGQIRQTHAKIHSAGHILDLAVQRLKYPWEAGKGYHFTDGPYVEYKGVFEKAEKALAEINTQIKHILSQKLNSNNKIFSYQEAVQEKLIAQTFKTSFVRVIWFGESSCPCGGTHIESTDEIKQLEVIKVQKKSKNVRVYYKVV